MASRGSPSGTHPLRVTLWSVPQGASDAGTWLGSANASPSILQRICFQGLRRVIVTLHRITVQRPPLMEVSERMGKPVRVGHWNPAKARRAGRTLSRLPELGQGLVEYALIIFLVAIVVIAILLLLGPQIGAVFSSIYSTI